MVVASKINDGSMYDLDFGNIDGPNKGGVYLKHTNKFYVATAVEEYRDVGPVSDCRDVGLVVYVAT